LAANPTLRINIAEEMNEGADHARPACLVKIRLRAERRWRKIYNAGEKAKGAREPGTDRGTTRSDDATASRTLAELGVTKDQAADWAKLAALSDEQFEAALAGSGKPTTTGIINGAKPTPVSDQALWLWGRLRDFGRHRLLPTPPAEVKIDQQREFVGTWDEMIRPNHRPETNSDRNYLPHTDVERLTGILQPQVPRWRTRLKKPDRTWPPPGLRPTKN
jgi:hypothetical protein